MPSTITDRLNGLTTSVAVKPPCRVATTVNITLSGLQTIDGVTVASGDRVLVKDQTTTSENGIYKADTGTWTRAADFDGSLDIVKGTLLTVHSGTVNSNTYWRVASGDGTVIGTDAITFAPGLIDDSAGITFIQSGAGAVERTVQAKAREIVSATDFGALGDDSSSNTAALQAGLDALSSGGTMFIPKGTFHSGALTVSNDNVKIVLEPGAVLKFPTLGSGVKAITVAADDFMIEGGTLEGPAAGVYVANENAIYMVGSSTSARKSGLTVRDVEIKNFGAHGIYAQFVDDIRVGDCKLHHCGYAGAMFLSCNIGWFVRNHVWTIYPGSGLPVMYGLSLTHDSTNYSSDPDAGTKDAAHPFCSSWSVEHNLIEDIDWEGIDAHGLYDSSVVFNKVYNTKNGIAVTNGSGDAVGYAGWNNNVSDNLVDGSNRNGTTSGREWESWGVNISGGSVVPHSNVTCSRNTILRKGVSSSADTASLLALRVARSTIADNIIDDWLGVGVGATLASGAVEGNTFGPRAAGYASDTAGRCIFDNGPTTGKLTVSDNRHTPGAGAVALVGFAQVAAATVRPYLSGNRLGAATTPFSLSTAGFCLGTDVTPVVTDTASGTELDLSALEGGYGVVHLSNGSPRTISTFAGAVTGQRVMLVNIGTGTQTVDRTNARTDGAANIDVTQYDVLELYLLATNDARQIAKMPSNG